MLSKKQIQLYARVTAGCVNFRGSELSRTCYLDPVLAQHLRAVPDVRLDRLEILGKYPVTNNFRLTSTKFELISPQRCIYIYFISILINASKCFRKPSDLVANKQCLHFSYLLFLSFFVRDTDRLDEYKCTKLLAENSLQARLF